MTSLACSRHEDKEIHRLIKMDVVGRKMGEGEGKRDKENDWDIEKEPTKLVKRMNQRSWQKKRKQRSW